MPPAGWPTSWPGRVSWRSTPSSRTKGLPGVLVGKELAKQTHLNPGQEVTLVAADTTVGRATLREEEHVLASDGLSFPAQ